MAGRLLSPPTGGRLNVFLLSQKLALPFVRDSPGVPGRPLILQCSDMTNLANYLQAHYQYVFGSSILGHSSAGENVVLKWTGQLTNKQLIRTSSQNWQMAILLP